MEEAPDITALLASARAGDVAARDRAVALLYRELSKIAHGRLAGETPLTNLDATALVHECYLRLAQGEPGRWENRRSFFAYASAVMRSVIVDVAREKAAQKRGGGLNRVTLTTGVAEDAIAFEQVTELDQALQSLGKLDPQLLEIVEMRYFGGLTVEDVSEVLSVSPITVKRKWAVARAFLFDELRR